jgi:NADH-quinone oxidoreductase subunit I
MCGLCIESCPSDALAFDNGFEHATFDRAALTKVLNKPDSVLMKDIKE